MSWQSDENMRIAAEHRNHALRMRREHLQFQKWDVAYKTEKELGAAIKLHEQLLAKPDAEDDYDALEAEEIKIEELTELYEKHHNEWCEYLKS